MFRQKTKWWTPILNFLIHTIVGTVIFLIVAIPAVGLSYLVEFLSGLHISAFTIQVLEFLEEGIFLVDAIAMMIYIGVTSYREVKEMTSAGEEDDDE